MITKEQALEILDKFDFFQGQRAGRELWSEKPRDAQNQDIENFKKDVDSLAEYLINTDLVEVVRCHNCKNRYVPHRCALWYATIGENEYVSERGSDFFCSYGERKE